MAPLSSTILAIRCECIIKTLNNNTLSSARRSLKAIAKDLAMAAEWKANDSHEWIDTMLLKSKIDQALIFLNGGNIEMVKALVEDIIRNTNPAIISENQKI